MQTAKARKLVSFLRPSTRAEKRDFSDPRMPWASQRAGTICVSGEQKCRSASISVGNQLNRSLI
jgi:hypothetical protein